MNSRPYDRLSAHEELCAERYEQIKEQQTEIKERMTRMEKFIVSALCIITTSLFGITGTLILQLIKIGNIATKLG